MREASPWLISLAAALPIALLGATGCDSPSSAKTQPAADAAEPEAEASAQHPIEAAPPAAQARVATQPAAARPAAARPETETPSAQDHAAGDSPATQAGAGRIVAKTFDDIKFDIEPDAPYDRSMLTDSIEALAGQRIRIRGWILPTFRTKGLKEFVLVRDNQECCFGPGAALFDCILVTMQPGRTAEFSTKSVAVEGEFQIEEFRAGRQLLAIYKLVGEQVE